MSTPHIGDIVRVVGLLTTAAGAPVDPTTLVVEITSPSGSVETFTLGTDVFPERDDVGVYHVDVVPSEDGDYEYKFTSTGTGQAVDRGAFRVKT